MIEFLCCNIPDPIIDKDLKDYKFFCFNGEPKFLKVDFGRFTEHRANYYDMEWNLLPFGEIVCPPDFKAKSAKPVNFEKMVDIAKKLSKRHPFLRVDLYNLRGRIYFGELTFYPASGIGRFTPDKYDEIIGEMLTIDHDASHTSPVIPSCKMTNR